MKAGKVRELAGWLTQFEKTNRDHYESNLPPQKVTTIPNKSAPVSSIHLKNRKATTATPRSPESTTSTTQESLDQTSVNTTPSSMISMKLHDDKFSTPKPCNLQNPSELTHAKTIPTLDHSSDDEEEDTKLPSKTNQISYNHKLHQRDATSPPATLWAGEEYSTFSDPYWKNTEICSGSNSSSSSPLNYAMIDGKPFQPVVSPPKRNNLFKSDFTASINKRNIIHGDDECVFVPVINKEMDGEFLSAPSTAKTFVSKKIDGPRSSFKPTTNGFSSSEFPSSFGSPGRYSDIIRGSVIAKANKKPEPHEKSGGVHCVKPKHLIDDDYMVDTLHINDPSSSMSTPNSMTAPAIPGAQLRQLFNSITLPSKNSDDTGLEAIFYEQNQIGLDEEEKVHDINISNSMQRILDSKKRSAASEPFHKATSSPTKQTFNEKGTVHSPPSSVLLPMSAQQSVQNNKRLSPPRQGPSLKVDTEFESTVDQHGIWANDTQIDKSVRFWNEEPSSTTSGVESAASAVPDCNSKVDAACSRLSDLDLVQYNKRTATTTTSTAGAFKSDIQDASQAATMASRSANSSSTIKKLQSSSQSMVQKTKSKLQQQFEASRLPPVPAKKTCWKLSTSRTGGHGGGYKKQVVLHYEK